MRGLNARRNPATMLQTVSVVGLTALVSGCAGDVMRFSDGFYTNSVPVRPPAAVQTPFPSNAPTIAGAQPAVQPLPSPATPGMVDPIATGSVSATPAPVTRTLMPAPSAQPLPPVPAQTTSVPSVQQITANAAQTANQTASTVANQAATAAANAAPRTGWNAAGGTYVTLREGETLYNLSRRYGVPVDALQRVNNISSARGVSAGQRVLIPTYVHGQSARVSAPDANPGVRSARSSTGGRADVNLASAPLPGQRPQGAITRPQPAVAAAQPAAAAGGRYTVQSGDTLSAISRRTGASVDAIKRTNSLTSDTVRIGQSLIIPGVAAIPASGTQTAAANVDPIVTSSVQSAPNNSSGASNSVSSIDSSSQASAPAATGVATMRWPVQGRVISAFGSNVGGRANDGIDISVPRGTPVKAAENGVVIYAGDGLKEFGQTVLVRHSNGYVTVYGHLDSMSVSRDDTVQRGQTIGASGMSGNARQPQLHFEVRKDSAPVDPVRYLN